VLVTGLIILSLNAFAGSAAAAPGVTPNGWTGACNMLEAIGVGAQGGMVRAGSVDDPIGESGMFWAVYVSGNVSGGCF
jgi:hypothetical protein